MKMRPVKSFSLFETLNHDWLTIERRGMQGSRSFNYEWENIDGRFNNRRYRLFRKRHRCIGSPIGSRDIKIA